HRHHPETLCRLDFLGANGHDTPTLESKVALRGIPTSTPTVAGMLLDSGKNNWRSVAAKYTLAGAAVMVLIGDCAHLARNRRRHRQEQPGSPSGADGTRCCSHGRDADNGNNANSSAGLAPPPSP